VKTLKIINYCFCPLSIFCILITGSRTGVFALAPAILYIGISASKLRIAYKAIMAVFATGVLLLVISITPDHTAKRLLSLGESIRYSDFGGRSDLWNRSIELFLSHPFLGIGCGALNSGEAIGEVAHNTFLSILTELGSIGLTIFILMLLIVMRQAAIGLRLKMRVWLFLLAVWGTGCMSLSWELTKTTWFIMSIIIASGKLINSEENSELSEPSGVLR
jgi:O-antigen ligase